MPRHVDDSLDPWLAESRADWRNRLTDWRAAPAEPLFHLLAAGLVAILLLRFLWERVQQHALGINVWLTDWWTWSLFALVIALALGQHAALRHRHAARRAHWMAAQPIPAAVARRNHRLHAVALAVVHATALLATGGAIDLPADRMLALVGVAFMAALPVLARPSIRQTPAPVQPRRRETPFESRGTGRVWRWQLIEIGSLLGPRQAALLVLMWLLVPAGESPPVALGFAISLALLALVTRAWQRSVAVLFTAQRWLACQPLEPMNLLRRWLPLPLLQLAFALLITGLALLPLGAAHLVLPTTLFLAAVGLLQLACVAAGRHRPQRAALLFAVHSALLLGLAQALPPGLLLAWPLQMAWLIRRSLAT